MDPAWLSYIIRPDDEKHTDISKAPNEPGIYAWYDRDGDLLYVGRSNAIAARLRQHRRRSFFWGGDPASFSYRLVPESEIVGVEVAHIKALRPKENTFVEGGIPRYHGEFRDAITAAWPDLEAMQARVDEKFSRIAEQIAARL